MELLHSRLPPSLLREWRNSKSQENYELTAAISQLQCTEAQEHLLCSSPSSLARTSTKFYAAGNFSWHFKLLAIINYWISLTLVNLLVEVLLKRKGLWEFLLNQFSIHLKNNTHFLPTSCLSPLLNNQIGLIN